MRSDAPLPDAARIDELLPQTQCRLCGHDGCAPYAQAIAAGRAGIDRCAPGGPETAQALARLTGLPYEPPDTARRDGEADAVAAIEEALCIGCALCLQACPVDAIVGAPKRMHTVIRDECTGCRLCVPPCPVDCIRMQPTGTIVTFMERLRRAPQYKRRHTARLERLARERLERTEAGRRKAAEARKRTAVEAAMRRARQRLQQARG